MSTEKWNWNWETLSRMVKKVLLKQNSRSPLDGHPFSLWCDCPRQITIHHTYTCRDTLSMREEKKWYRLSNCCCSYPISSFVYYWCHTFFHLVFLNKQLYPTVANCSIIIVHFAIDSFHHIFFHCPRELCSQFAFVCAHLHFFWLALLFLFLAARHKVVLVV